MVSWLQLEGRAFWAIFVAAFLLVAVWESFYPRRRLVMPLAQRWSRHGLVLLIGTFISASIFRLTPVAVALAFAGNRFGVLNKTVLPFALRFVLGVLALDLTRYAVHWTLHATRLWRIHQVHHSDPDFDVSTGARAHPLEIILNQAAIITTILLLAPPVAAVLFVELASQVQSFFSHANACLPVWLDRALRRVWVTPDMHRVHHSARVNEQFRNLAEIFSFWDRIFGTYLSQPAAGHENMTIGLEEMQDARALSVRLMLTQPFRRQPSPATPTAPAATTTVR